ncbi:MAG: hypothetical protein HRF43_11955 [Phycisphaerae bacterium]|jgi:hypothetical protein
MSRVFSLNCRRIAAVLMVPAVAGCGGVRVSVDARLVEDSTLWHYLDGPSYRIVGQTPESESSLEFQEYAALLAAALREPRPNLRRLRDGPAPPTETRPAAGPRPRPGASTRAAPEGGAARPPQRPDIVFTFSFHAIDRGTAVESYPVYANRRAWVYGPYGARTSYYSSSYAGQAVQTVSLGFAHGASLSAWVWDAGQPTGRRVLWEGRAGLVSSTPDLRATMPYLVVALATWYGQPTPDGPAVMKFKTDDERIQSLRVPPDSRVEPASGG